MPLIAPVLPTLAAPSTETSAAAPASVSSDSAPRFSDALSRAGQSQSAADNATNQAGTQGKAAGAPPQANAQQSASADTRDSKTQARSDDAQQTTQNAAASDAGASLLALQAGGLLQAATAPPQSGKNLPHDSRKAAAAATSAATPALTPGMMLNLAVTAQPAQTADAKKTSAAVAISAAPSPANLPDAAQQSGPLKSAQQNALPSAATPLTDHLPAWLQGAAGRGADASQLGSFVTLHSARAASADASTLATAQPARAEPAAATTAPGQLAPSIALALPQGVQTPQAAAGATVQPPMGSPDWGQAMNQQVLFAAQGQQQFATLHLNPPQLGPLEVHLQLHDGQIQAQFVSPHAVVRQAVEAALPQLRDLFTGAGLSLMQTFVGTQGGQGERQQQARTQRGAARVSANGGAGAERSGAAAALPQRWQQGMVNTYV